jgi:hypothetical protein
MKAKEIHKIARQWGISPARTAKADLIRAIQRAEGNFDCFGTAVNGSCDQDGCLWREDCFVESGVAKLIA